MNEVTRESHGTRDEPFLETLLAGARYRRSLRFIRRLLARGIAIRGIDLGCGYEGRFVRRARAIPGVMFAGGDTNVRPGEPHLFEFDFHAPPSLPFQPNLITMHAVLEHLDDPESVLRYLHAALTPGGYLLLTVPSTRAQPVLEFLAFRLGLISRVEIADHKRYYDRDSIVRLLQQPGARFEAICHTYFQLGFNNAVTARKSGHTT